jgi:hypothetical protein
MASYTFPPTSRYYGITQLNYVQADGETLAYLARRFLPPSSQFALLHTHVVVQGERLDVVAARELSDAQAFWRICDANDAVRPDDLMQPLGRVLRITLPAGIPAPAAG